MHKGFPLLALVFFSFSINAQKFCFTPPKSSKQQTFSPSLLRVSANDRYCLRTYIHVIRRSNGAGGQSVESVKTAMSYLNFDFNQHGIYFKWYGEIDYINDDFMYNNPSSSIFDTNSHEDGIDIYLYHDGAYAGGAADGIGESSAFYVSGTYWNAPYNPMVRSRVVSHEMGHVLFLWHTHHGTSFESGSDNNQCKELVNGSNSTVCGDYVSDTPADPFLRFEVNPETCTWLNTGKDANNEPYNPDEKLIMSYTNVDCMSYFTNEQGARMRNAIATLPHLIKARVTCSDDCIATILAEYQAIRGQIDTKIAKISITAINRIELDANASYSAGQWILLDKEFDAQTGCNFDAFIKDCVRPPLEAKISSTSTLAQEGDSSKIEADQEPKFMIYPNPANTFATINCKFENNKGAKATLYDNFGNMIKTTSFSTASTTINVADIASGVYLVKVDNEFGEYGVQKLIVKH